MHTGLAAAPPARIAPILYGGLSTFLAPQRGVAIALAVMALSAVADRPQRRRPLIFVLRRLLVISASIDTEAGAGKAWPALLRRSRKASGLAASSSATLSCLLWGWHTAEQRRPAILKWSGVAGLWRSSSAPLAC